MWDDDEQYVPRPEHEVTQRLLQVAPNALGEEQNQSLVFSTEDLKKEYLKLKLVSKEWQRREEPELRKTTNTLLTGSPKKMRGDSELKRQTMVPDKAAIEKLGKNLLRMSLDKPRTMPPINLRAQDCALSNF